MKTSPFSIIGEDFNEDTMEAIRLLLLEKSRYTLLPELYEVFGKDHFLKFLDVFAGSEFQVPDRDTLMRVIENASAYVSMRRNSHAATVDYLAKRYNVSTTTIWNRYRRTEKIVAEMGMGEITKDV